MSEEQTNDKFGREPKTFWALFTTLLNVRPTALWNKLLLSPGNHGRLTRRVGIWYQPTIENLAMLGGTESTW